MARQRASGVGLGGGGSRGPRGRRAAALGPVDAAGLDLRGRGRAGRFGRWWAAGGWYWLLIVGSAGLLTFVPFLTAARRVPGSRFGRWAAAYGGFDVALVVLIGIEPADAAGNPAGTAGQVLGTLIVLGLIALLLLGSVHFAVARPRMYPAVDRPAPHAHRPPVGPAVEPAVARVLAARQRREQARELVARDPLMARELHIGRPDLASDYDDGGLVDLNSAPGPVIARVCELTQAQGAAVAAARQRRGVGFTNVDEVFVLVDLPVGTWDRVRDHAVLLPD